MTTAINFTVGIAKVGRAPKGGTVSGVNGRFYKGGWFMPLESAPPAALTVEDVVAPLGGRLNEWIDRVYVNFADANRTWNGDRNGKLWFYADDASRLFAERGKGMRSPAFADAFDAAVIALESAGFAVARR